MVAGAVSAVRAVWVVTQEAFKRQRPPRLRLVMLVTVRTAPMATMVPML
jgi:hypothetical protein